MPAPFLNLVVLRVPDIDAAQRFYALLGFSFTRHAHGSGPPHYAAENGSQVFEIYPQLDADDSTTGVRIGFRVSGLDAVVARLAEGGAKMVSAPKDSPWGRRAVVADPIGHKIELLEDAAPPPTTQASLASESFTRWRETLFRTRTIAPLRFGASQKDVTALFGSPDDVSFSKRGRPVIFKYADIEFHFDYQQGHRLFLVYAEDKEGEPCLSIMEEVKKI